MRKLLFAGIVLIASALAGCSDAGEATDAATDDCPEATHFVDAEGACIAHVEPRIILTGLNGSIEQYKPATFNWALDPGTRATEEHKVHSMDSRILGSMTDDPIGNETGPDDWGTEITKQQHKDFPAAFDASIVWDTPGTLYLKGYMLIEGKDVWQELGTIEVAPVTASGVTHNVTLQSPQSTSGAPAPDQSEVGMVVGDAVVFQNDNTFDYEASFDCSGYTIDPITIAGGASSSPITFLEPTSCTVSFGSPLAATGSDPAGFAVKLNVNTP